jgi:protein TonB
MGVFGPMRLWRSMLFSLLFHAALFCIPVAVLISREPQCRELQLVVLKDVLPKPRENSQQSPPAGETEPVSKIEPDPPVPPVRVHKTKPVMKVQRKPPPEDKPVREQPRIPASPTTPTPEPVAKENKSEEAQPGYIATANNNPSSKPVVGSPLGQAPAEASFGSSEGPHFLKRELPKYPVLAREREKEGTVILRLSIDELGRLVDVSILRRAGSGFDEEAVRAVRNSSFSPARKNGKPVSCWARLPIRFVLRSSEDD